MISSFLKENTFIDYLVYDKHYFTWLISFRPQLLMVQSVIRRLLNFCVLWEELISGYMGINGVY
jgi:hypothetical protein